MVVPFNFRLICLKLGVELDKENKKIIDDRLCVCLAILNIRNTRSRIEIT